LAITAAVGVASSSATTTVLCKSVPSSKTCPSGEVLPAGSWASYELYPVYPDEESAFTLKISGGLNFACRQGGMGGESKAVSAEKLPVSGGMVLYSCSLNKGPECTRAIVGGVAGNVQSFGLNAVWWIGNSSEPFTIDFQCKIFGATVECKFADQTTLVLLSSYSTETHLETIGVWAGKQMVRTSGGCGETAEVDLHGANVTGNYPHLG